MNTEGTPVIRLRLLALASASLLVAGAPSPEPAAPPPSAAPQTRIERPADEDRSPAATALTEAFRRAHEARDLPAFEKLVEWTDVTASMRKVALESFELNLGQRIQAIFVTPADPKEDRSFTLDSVTYRPNLAPFRVLTVWFEIAGPEWAGGVMKTSYLVGRAPGGSYRIAAPAPAR
jgi:hypothetical protein